MRLLAITSDQPLASQLAAHLALQTEFLLASTLLDALLLAQLSPPTLIVADRGDIAPGQIRQVSLFAALPLVVISPAGRRSHFSELKDLDEGADLVIRRGTAKEIVARLRAFVRAVTRTRPRAWTLHDLVLDPLTCEVRVNRRRVVLTPVEFRILARLLQSGSRVTTRDALIAEIWGRHPPLTGKALDVRLHWLRRKLGDDPRAPRYIQNVRGIGYKVAGR